MRSINADGDGSNGSHGLLQGVFIELSHIDEAGTFSPDVLGLETAGAVLRDGTEEKVQEMRGWSFSGMKNSNRVVASWR